MAKVDWCINDHERHTIIRIAHITWKGFSRAGLPTPVLEPWVAENRPEDSVIIDMAHTIGTTRMLTDPKLGVVDDNCQVHCVRNIYVAGGVCLSNERQCESDLDDRGARDSACRCCQASP